MPLNIAYSSDNSYAKQLGISILSLLENNKEEKEINIYVVDNKIEQDNKQKIESIVKQYDRKIIFLQFEQLSKGLKTDNKFPASAFGRIFLSRIPNIDKILYIDCDTLICDSLKELFKIDISQYYVGGCQDNVAPLYRELVGLGEEDRYINSGVLLINLKKWREDNIEEKCMKFIEHYNGSVPHHDQGTINGVCKGKIYILPSKYNLQCPMFSHKAEEIKKLEKMKRYYTQEEIELAKKEPVIVHFTNGFFNRPWNKKCTHPLKDKYLYYMNKSPWKGQLEDKKLSKKIEIKKILYNILPFDMYCIISEFLSRNKKERIRNKYAKYINNNTNL